MTDTEKLILNELRDLRKDVGELRESVAALKVPRLARDSGLAGVAGAVVAGLMKVLG